MAKPTYDDDNKTSRANRRERNATDDVIESGSRRKFREFCDESAKDSDTPKRSDDK